MTKKGKLIGSIACILFILIMIPVAIFATQSSASFNIANRIIYNAEYLDGEFYYAITGNNRSELNVGYSSAGVIDPVLVFVAKFDNNNNTDIVTPDSNMKQVDNAIYIPNKGLEFDLNHREICYYFMYVNKATESTDPGVSDDRSVTLFAQANTSAIPNYVTSSWSYYQNSEAVIYGNAFGKFAHFQDSDYPWTTEDSYFANGIKLNAVTSNGATKTYNYVIMKFTLTLTDTGQPTFKDAELKITINLNGEHNKI